MKSIVWKKKFTRCSQALFHSDRGFTLVELIIVVAIIGIISAIAVPIYSNYVTTARQSNAEAVLLQLPILMEQYRAESLTGDLCPSPPCADDNITDATISAFLPGFAPEYSSGGINYRYNLLFDSTGKNATLTVTLSGDATGTYTCSFPEGTCP